MIAHGLLRCTTGANHFAMRAEEVRHIARADQMKRDAGEDGRAGFLKLGGQTVPVFDLRHALQLPEGDTATADRHIAITGDHRQLVGWLVDRIVRDSRAAATLAPLPSFIGASARRWLDGVAIGADEAPLLLINPRRLAPNREDADAFDDLAPAFAVPPLAGRQPADPVALVFSSAALPPSTINKYALSGREVAAIVQDPTSLPVPGAAAHVGGIFMWRNVVVPIVDFQRASTPPAVNRRRLIARCHANGQHSLIAITIDADVLMHRPSAENTLATEVACPRFASGVFELDGDKVALLDPGAIAGADLGLRH